MTQISSPNGETLVISKQRDNYNFDLGCSTVQEDNKNNYLLLKGDKFVGEYHRPTRTLRINTDEGTVEFKLSKEEHRRYEKGLKMIQRGEELPTTV